MVISGVITSSDSVEGSMELETSTSESPIATIEGDVITGMIEFKRVTFETDQVLAEMLCTLTDCSLEQLKDGKLLKKAMIYGLSINYKVKRAEVFKVTLKFDNKKTRCHYMTVLIS